MNPDRTVHFTTVATLFSKFKRTGSVLDIKHGSQPMETDEEELIVAFAEAHPSESLKEQAKATGRAKSTVSKILKRHGQEKCISLRTRTLRTGRDWLNGSI